MYKRQLHHVGPPRLLANQSGSILQKHGGFQLVVLHFLRGTSQQFQLMHAAFQAVPVSGNVEQAAGTLSQAGDVYKRQVKGVLQQEKKSCQQRNRGNVEQRMHGTYLSIYGIMGDKN